MMQTIRYVFFLSFLNRGVFFLLFFERATFFYINSRFSILDFFVRAKPSFINKIILYRTTVYKRFIKRAKKNSYLLNRDERPIFAYTASSDSQELLRFMLRRQIQKPL